MAFLLFWCGEYFGVRNILVLGEVPMQGLILSQELMERTLAWAYLRGCSPGKGPVLEQKGSVRRKECQRECYELMTVLIPHCLTLPG